MRILLYLATNLSILVLLGIVMSVLGVDTTQTSGLLVFAALFGVLFSFRMATRRTPPLVWVGARPTAGNRTPGPS